MAELAVATAARMAREPGGGGSGVRVRVPCLFLVFFLRFVILNRMCMFT